MLDLVAIKVECYSGYKADEYPRCFYLWENKFDIRDITDRWYQGNLNPALTACDYFKVETTSGKQYIIKHDLEKDLWFMVVSKI
jgi:hypothetical protein